MPRRNSIGLTKDAPRPASAGQGRHKPITFPQIAMNTELLKYENAELGLSVRTVIINDEPWFVAKDICDALEVRTSNLRSILEDDEIRNDYTIDIAQNGGRAPLIISESGLYSLILRSRKPEAKRFKKWVTSEVLPSIRKHGVYGSPAKVQEWLNDPDAMIQTLQALRKEQEKRQELEARLEEVRPKVLFCEALMTSPDSVTAGELAKMLRQKGVDMGPRRLFRWFRRNGYLGRKGVHFNVPSQYAMERGLFEIKRTFYADSDGASEVVRTVKVTGKGQVYFIKKFLLD